MFALRGLVHDWYFLRLDLERGGCAGLNLTLRFAKFKVNPQYSCIWHIIHFFTSLLSLILKMCTDNIVNIEGF